MENQTEVKPTGCCPPFNPEPWDNKEIMWDNKLFVKDHTMNFFHVPLNFGGVMKRMMEKITKAEAEVQEDYIILTRDLSAWKSEQLIHVSKEVPDMENIKLSGTFLTKVFEGPYKKAKNWCTEMEKHVESKGKKIKKLYFFYTTCPKCMKVYGKNYVVGVAQIS